MNPEEVLVELARKALDIALIAVPHDKAKELLDEAAVRRANALVDAVEAAKFDEK